MPSLPPPLQNRLRDVLLKCAPFGSNDALRAVFSDARIAAWQHNVPEAATSASRVSFLVSQFMDAWNADGENALSLFLCALVQFPDRGAQCPTADLCALSAEVHKTLIAGKIAECERELAQVKDHQARRWSDPAYSQRRAAELQAQIQTWQQRQESPPPCPAEPLLDVVMDTDVLSTRAPETYTDLEIHIAPDDVGTGRYAVTAELDGEGRYPGILRMGMDERISLSSITDPEAYGLALFDALFTGQIHTAYTTARERARTRTAGRLRLRLWIDHKAADLHTLIWERLYYRSEGAAFRIATDAKLPFSRYFGLQGDEAAAIVEPVRMLCVIANPDNLAAYDLTPLTIEDEIANLRAALDGLQKSGVSVTLMPGWRGLSADQMQSLTAAGYAIIPGPVTLGHIQQQLMDKPGYHIVHLLGHGTFSQSTGRAALMLEDKNGQVQAITDRELQQRLAGLEHKPHLIFLAACESAKREHANYSADVGNPFMGLAQHLVQIDIPAVVAMQDKIAVPAAQELTRYFYHYLLQHGVVDKALNQARGFLVDAPDWATPALFMRLREGRLLK